MRTLMTIMTLSAATAGYFYLQRTPPAGEPYEVTSTAARLQEEARREYSRLADVSRGSVKELVSRVHQHTKSVLDDFANQHGGHSDAPTDDAFQRLKQVTQSAVDALVTENSPATNDLAKTKPIRLPPTKLDDLQRIAFDPSVAIDPIVEQMLSQQEGQHEESAKVAAGTPSTKTDPVLTEPVQPAPAEEVAAQTAESPVVAPQIAQTEPSVAKSEPSMSPGSGIANVSRQETKPVVKQTIAPVQPPTSKPMLANEWKVIGKTTEGRKMHSTHLGTTGTRTLVIAGLNGEDRVAVRWLEQLADTMASRPELTNNIEVVFFRAGNPDGLVRKTRNNARGVPLNRNFPSRGYRPVVGVPSFAVPASEVETRVILDTLYSFRPRRVIHLSSTTGAAQTLYNLKAKASALELERTAQFKPVQLDPEQSPGSLEDFADGTLEATVLSLKVNVGSDWQQTWNRVQPQILAAVVGRPINSGDAESSPEKNLDGIAVPYSNIEPISRNPRRRGFEELPAPPQ